MSDPKNNDTQGLTLMDGLEVGAIYFGEKNKLGATIIQKGITATNPKIQFTKDVITSNSAYTHNANSNAGSLSVSGSYGVSGISQVKGGLSVSISRDASATQNSISIDMQRLVVAGIEYIDFNQLKPEEFIGGLKGNIGGLMTDVVGAYSECMTALKTLKDKSGSGILKSDDAVKKLSEWQLAKENFFNAAGDMLVVGVVWGGYGGVNLNFSGITNETLWKAGGKAQFSYAGVGASVGVDASFAHMELSEEQLKSGKLTRISHGNCVDTMVTKWEEKLTDILTNNVTEITKTKVTDLPQVSIPSIPDAPPFEKPDPPEGLADKIGEVSDIEGLKALSQARAYDAYEKKEKEAGRDPKSFEDFLKEAGSPNDVSGLDEEIEPSRPSDNSEQLSDRSPILDMSGKALAGEEKEDPPAGTDLFADYVAMGAWLVPWGQIFPWLAEMRDNIVPKGALNSNLAKLRMMESDLRTLSRTYEQVSVLGLSINDGPGEREFTDLASSFKVAASHARELLADQMTVPGGKDSDGDLGEKIQSNVFGHMSDRDTKIYNLWVSTPELRRSELGTSIDVNYKVFYKIGTVDRNDRHGPNDAERVVTEADNTQFDITKKNYNVFYNTIKANPIIIPDGDEPFVGAFISWDDDDGNPFSGFVVSDNLEEQCISFQSTVSKMDKSEAGTPYASVVRFRRIDGFGGALQGCIDGTLVTLWPIPYTAADGVDWYGGASAIGISDMTDKIAALKDQLSQLQRISFGHEYWPDSGTWSLSLSQLKPSYIGLIEEPGNVFNNSN